MKIFVTGATGFVGKTLSKALLRKGHEVYCLVRDKEKAQHSLDVKCNFVVGSIGNLDQQSVEIMNDCEVIYHLAACVHSSKVHEFFTTNVNGTQNLIRLISESKNLKRFIYLSSLAVIGHCPVQDNKYNPFSPYGKSKLIAEVCIKSFFRDRPNVKCLIIRSPVVYGENQPNLVTEFFQKIYRNELRIPGNGSNARRMCYIGNLVKGLLGSLEYEPEHSSQIINIADKEVYSLKTLIDNISLKMTAAPSKIKWLPAIIADAGLMVYKTVSLFGINIMPLFVFGTTKASIDCDMNLTNSSDLLAAEYSFEEGMERTINWLKSEHLLEYKTRLWRYAIF